MIISRAPVRISFFGGGTDYPEYFRKHNGAVLATAINKYSYITASRFLSQLFDYSIRVSYRKVELVKTYDEIEHNVYRECLRRCNLERDIELHNVADLPAFTGLGSSSSFTVSLLHALHAFKGEFIKPLDLAREAIDIERNVLKDNVGCQDQTIAAIGGFHLVEFRSESDIVVNRVSLSPERLDEFHQHLFVVFTGMRRKASDVVAHQLRRISDNTETLNDMRHMVDEGWNILHNSRSFYEFGSLLDRAWKAKRRLDSSISTPTIDTMYEMGMSVGAWGGKLLGAGGGGFLLFMCPPERIEHLKEVFGHYNHLGFQINAPGSQIIFS